MVGHILRFWSLILLNRIVERRIRRREVRIDEQESDPERQNPDEEPTDERQDELERLHLVAVHQPTRLRDRFECRKFRLVTHDVIRERVRERFNDPWNY